MTVVNVVAEHRIEMLNDPQHGTITASILDEAGEP
jgi:hypothetical protein